MAISFTGGTATGAIVASHAGRTFKKLSLELGGKNPNIIFAGKLLKLLSIFSVKCVVLKTVIWNALLTLLSDHHSRILVRSVYVVREYLCSVLCMMNLLPSLPRK